MKIKALKVRGVFKVNGIVNFNSVGKKEGHANHRYAKKMHDGRDYTSANCLRQAMFADFVPRQPSSEQMKKDYPIFMGTLAGILRGGMEADSGVKGKSPFTLLDAVTTGEKPVVITEQNTSSKPKETNLKSKSGEQKSDTSMFSTDNAGPREQSLEAVIRVRDLQLREIGSDDAIVRSEHEQVYIDSLKATMDVIKAPTELVVGDYCLSTQISKVPRKGIKFSDDQLRRLVQCWLQLLTSIEVNRRNASLTVKQDSLSVDITYEDGSCTTGLGIVDVQNVLSTASFQQFWVNAG